MPQNWKVEMNWSENKAILKSEEKVFQLDIDEWWSVAKALVKIVVEECESGRGDIVFVYPKSKKKFTKKRLKEWESDKKRYKNPIILKYEEGRCVFYEGDNLIPLTPEDLLKLYKQKTPNKKLFKINIALEICSGDPLCILSLFNEPGWMADKAYGDFKISITKWDGATYELFYKTIKELHEKGCLVESFEDAQWSPPTPEEIIENKTNIVLNKPPIEIPIVNLNPSRVVELFKMSYNYWPLDKYGRSKVIGFLIFKIKDFCKKKN